VNIDLDSCKPEQLSGPGRIHARFTPREERLQSEGGTPISNHLRISEKKNEYRKNDVQLNVQGNKNFQEQNEIKNANHPIMLTSPNGELAEVSKE
jgi:hypothetical protein